jgi:hypothetical protein
VAVQIFGFLFVFHQVSSPHARVMIVALLRTTFAASKAPLSTPRRGYHPEFALTTGPCARSISCSEPTASVTMGSGMLNSGVEPVSLARCIIFVQKRCRIDPRRQHIASQSSCPRNRASCPSAARCHSILRCLFNPGGLGCVCAPTAKCDFQKQMNNAADKISQSMVC